MVRVEVGRRLRQYGFAVDDRDIRFESTVDDDELYAASGLPGWDMIGEPVAVYDGSPPEAAVPRIPVELLREHYAERLLVDEPAPSLHIESSKLRDRRRPPIHLDDRGCPLPSTVAEVAESSFSTAEAAEILGVNASRIRQRLGDRSLYGFKHGGAWKVPSWQIEAGSTLPHLATIVRELDPDSSPVGVTRWFTSLGNDLLTPSGPEGSTPSRLLSPRQWLAEGRDPAPVVAQALRL